MRKGLGICLICLVLSGCGGKDLYFEESMGVTVKEEIKSDETKKESTVSMTRETEKEGETAEQVSGVGETEAPDCVIDPNVLRWNTMILETPGTGLQDLSVYPDTVFGKEVSQMIEVYQFPEKPYLNGEALQAKSREAIERQRNLEEIPEQVKVRFCIVTENAAVRSFPTNEKVSDSVDENAFDYFQQTMLLFGEGAAVLHQTQDQAWSFVRSKNYSGWVETEKIAFCNKKEMAAMTAVQNFLVVTDEMYLDGARYRMGTMLQLESEKEQYYIARRPVRGEDGNLRTEYVQIEKSEPVHRGFLPLEQELAAAQAMKLLGMPYGWGDSDENMDCSSTMGAVYRCFGLELPRDTSAQKLMCTKDLTGLSVEEKKAILEQTPPGTLIYMPGHVMMYWGMEGGDYLILHNVTSYFDHGVKTDAYECRCTSLNLNRLNGQSYWEALTGIWEILP